MLQVILMNMVNLVNLVILANLMILVNLMKRFVWTWKDLTISSLVESPLCCFDINATPRLLRRWQGSSNSCETRITPSLHQMLKSVFAGTFSAMALIYSQSLNQGIYGAYIVFGKASADDSPSLPCGVQGSNLYTIDHRVQCVFWAFYFDKKDKRLLPLLNNRDPLGFRKFKVANVPLDVQILGPFW